MAKKRGRVLIGLLRVGGSGRVREVSACDRRKNNNNEERRDPKKKKGQKGGAGKQRSPITVRAINGPGASRRSSSPFHGETDCRDNSACQNKSHNRRIYTEAAYRRGLEWKAQTISIHGPRKINVPMSENRAFNRGAGKSLLVRGTASAEGEGYGSFYRRMGKGGGGGGGAEEGLASEGSKGGGGTRLTRKRKGGC